MSQTKRIVIAGGSGFIGHALTRAFIAHGFEVAILSRSPKPRTDGVQEVEWNGKQLGEWIQVLKGAEAVINLTGKNINCPHTPENLAEITGSRVESVKMLAAAIPHVKAPPRVWVQASAVGFYGDTKDVLCDEDAPNGCDPLSTVCLEWEKAFAAVQLPKLRKVTLRIGFVLGREGGALPVLTKLAKSYLGGAVGDGKQYISWIHLADLVQMFVAAVTDENVSGTYNAVAPSPVTNAEFMGELRQSLGRPWSPSVPKFAVKLGARFMGSEPSLALVSQRCDPKRFLAAGFRFQFTSLAPALKDLAPKIKS